MTPAQRLQISIERCKRLLLAKDVATIREDYYLPYSVVFHACEMVNSPVIDENQKEVFAFRVAKSLDRLSRGEDAPALVNPHGEDVPAFSAE